MLNLRTQISEFSWLRKSGEFSKAYSTYQMYRAVELSDSPVDLILICCQLNCLSIVLVCDTISRWERGHVTTSGGVNGHTSTNKSISPPCLCTGTRIVVQLDCQKWAVTYWMSWLFYCNFLSGNWGMHAELSNTCANTPLSCCRTWLNSASVVHMCQIRPNNTPQHQYPYLHWYMWTAVTHRL